MSSTCKKWGCEEALPKAGAAGNYDSISIACNQYRDALLSPNLNTSFRDALREGLQQAACMAARNSHTMCLRVLHQNGFLEEPHDAFESAAKNGHLDTIRFLVDEAGARCETEVVKLTAGQGHLQCLTFLFTRGFFCPESGIQALRSAASNGHLKLVEYLIDDLGVTPDSTISDLTAKYGNSECLTFLYNKGCTCSEGVADDVAAGGNSSCLRFLYDRGFQCTVLGVNSAAQNGHVKTLQFLYDHGLRCSAEAMTLASCHPDCFMILFDVNRFGPGGISEDVSDLASKVAGRLVCRMAGWLGRCIMGESPDAEECDRPDSKLIMEKLRRFERHKIRIRSPDILVHFVEDTMEGGPYADLESRSANLVWLRRMEKKGWDVSSLGGLELAYVQVMLYECEECARLLKRLWPKTPLDLNMIKEKYSYVFFESEMYIDDKQLDGEWLENLLLIEHEKNTIEKPKCSN